MKDTILQNHSQTILKYQFDVAIEKEISGKELLARKAINPIDGIVIPILPGFFVKEDMGTGLVMSVPTMRLSIMLHFSASKKKTILCRRCPIQRY